MYQSFAPPADDLPDDSLTLSPTTSSLHQIPALPRTSSEDVRPRNPRSCTTCRRRKVRCDKQEPSCSNCTKAGAQTQCVFPAPGRAPRRPRAGGKPVSERESELLKRLRKLEGVVEELSGQVEVENVRNSPGSDDASIHTQKEGEPGYDNAAKGHKVRVLGMDEGNGTKKAWISRSINLAGPSKNSSKNTFQLERGFGKLVLDEGKSEYISNPFWAELAEEVASLREIVDEQEADSEPDFPEERDDHTSFVMGYRSCDVDLKSLHPLPSQIPFYWQTFVENVNPLVKILHIPTMNRVIKEVQHKLDSLSKSTEALMFSIYFAVITSLTPEEVVTNFGETKDALIRKYRFAEEQALARADLLNTNEIVTVQAVVLFLICVRRFDETRFAWSMTGLVLKLAHALGLHRDGSKLNLSPFDTEMRRRLWWQICLLDSRAAEDHGSDPSIFDHTFDTMMPLSINDDDLSIDDKEAPEPRVGVSDMTFCLIRYEICSLSRRLNYIPPGIGPCRMMPATLTLEQKENAIKECAEYLEVKYFQFCEDAGPLYWVAATVARLIFAKMSLIIYHPLLGPSETGDLSDAIKDRLFMASIEIIEYSRILETEASTKQWGWLFHNHVQWHAIVFVLGELSQRSKSAVVERAWRAVDGVFHDWSEAISSSKSGHLWGPMRKLMAKARRRREQNIGTVVSDTNELANKDSTTIPVAVTPLPYPMLTNALAQHHYANAQLMYPYLALPETPPHTSSNPDPSHMEPQIMGMGTLAPENVQYQLQQSQQQQTPWLMDDNALLDLDMGDEAWAAPMDWADVARDFQMANGQEGAPMGRVTGWW